MDFNDSTTHQPPSQQVRRVRRKTVETYYLPFKPSETLWHTISLVLFGIGCKRGCRDYTGEPLLLHQCSSAEMIRTTGLPHLGSLEIMFGGTAATGKDAFTPGQTPIACTEGSRDSSGSKEFVDPQCEEPLGVDPMSAEGPSVSRSAATVNKGKGLAANVQLFKGPSKRRPKPHITLQEMGSTLKAMSNVIIESRSASTRTPPVFAVAIEVQKAMDMVISLPGVQLGDRLHMFSTDFFMGHPECMHMFFALATNTEVQLQWLEKQYDKMPEYR